MSRDDGLWIFLVVQFLNICGLVLDLFLWRFGYVTITDFARRNWLASAMILQLQGFGVVGLGVHLSRSFNGHGDR